MAVIYAQTGAVRLFEDLESARLYVNPSSWHKCIFRNSWELKAWSQEDLVDLWAIIYDHSAWGLLPPKRKFVMPGEAAKGKTHVGPLLESDVAPAEGLSWDELAASLWDMIQRRGDRVHRLRPTGVKNKDHYDIDLDYLRSLTVDAGIFKATFNKQQRAILSEFMRRGRRYYLLGEIKTMMYEIVANRQMKTKQDAFLIFQYYRQDFISKGAMTVGTDS